MAGHVVAGERDPACGWPAQSDERLDELILAVAGDPRDAQDLAGPDVKVDAPDDLRAAIVGDPQTFDPKGDLGRVRRAPVDRELDFAPDHELGEVVLVRLGWDPRADDPAAPDDRNPVGDLEDLVQLVADEHDAVALGGKPSEDREDLLGLLRRQDGRRLVEDQDARLAVEGLEDLHPLLPANRQGRDPGVGLDLEVESPAQLKDPPASFAPVEEDRIGHRFFAEEDVLRDAQDGDEHEVLVDHADATGDGVGRPGDRDRKGYSSGWSSRRRSRRAGRGSPRGGLRDRCGRWPRPRDSAW